MAGRNQLAATTLLESVNELDNFCLLFWISSPAARLNIVDLIKHFLCHVSSFC